MNLDLDEDIPNTGHGLVPPTPDTIPGRLLAVEVRSFNNSRAIARLEGIAVKLTLTIISASLGVILTVIGAALYVGGRFQAVSELDRRVSRIEDQR
jgi:hypothetical protein